MGVDTHIVCLLLEYAFINKVKNIIFVSGDGDFEPMISKLNQ